jgi:hypothetical protein
MNNILKDKTHRDEAWPQESLKLESKEKKIVINIRSRDYFIYNLGLRS